MNGVVQRIEFLWGAASGAAMMVHADGETGLMVCTALSDAEAAQVSAVFLTIARRVGLEPIPDAVLCPHKG